MTELRMVPPPAPAMIAEHLVEEHGWPRSLVEAESIPVVTGWHDAEHRNLTPRARERRLSYHLDHRHE